MPPLATPPAISRSTSLRRGLEILLVLGSEAPPLGGLGVTRIAAITGFEKSQVSRALAALADNGFVERAPGGRGYRLGWACFALAARAGEPRLLEEAAPVLAALMAEVSETAHLSVLRGNQVLTLLSESPPHAIAARGWVGRTVPAYCSSAGRALLIDHDRAALVELLGAEPFAPAGPKCATGVDELERRIRRARQVGYASAIEESEPGLVAVAAPIRDPSGRVVAAINVSAPKFRLGRRLADTGLLVRAAAERLSGAFGTPAVEGIAELAQ
jgi:IclR family transcriptional regulator, KDG regulon repressor